MNREEMLLFKQNVNDEIERYLSTLSGSKLRGPMTYALNSGGKRLRPILAGLISESIAKGQDVIHGALAIEFFHTASLIADDLPCMDDDDYRRGKPSLHKKFSESTALLASYALLTEGFSQIEQSGRVYREKGYGSEEDANKRVRIALEETVKLSGPLGVVLGQYHDIEQIKAHSEQEFEKMYYLKTGTLFQGAFTLGYIFGGGDLEKLYAIEKLARHLGFAFQIRDDFEDIGQEEHSFVREFGEEHAYERLQKEVEGFYKALDLLDLNQSVFEEMINFLFPTVKHQISLHALL